MSSSPSSSSSFATLDEALLTQDPQKLFFIINGDSPIVRSRTQQQRLLTVQQQFAAAQTSLSTSINSQPASLLSSLLLCVSRLVALVKTSVTHRKLEPAMRTSDLGLETHKQASLLLYATQAPGASASVLSAAEFARLRLILTLSLVQLIEVKATWLEDATIFQKSIEQLQAFFKFAQGLDVDVYILYVRLLLKYSSSLLRHEASAAIVVEDYAKKQLQSHQKAIYAKSNLELTQQILKRGLAQGVAICIALVDEFCGDEYLEAISPLLDTPQPPAQSVKKSSLLPLYDTENNISFRDAFRCASNPQSVLDRPQFVAHVPEEHRATVLRHIVCLFFAHVCWALLARGGSMEDIQSEFVKILRHLCSGSGNVVPREAPPMPGFSKLNLWELVFACFKTAMRDAPEPTAAAEIALALHDATIEFITMHATSQPSEMKNLKQNLAHSSNSSNLAHSSNSSSSNDEVLMSVKSSREKREGELFKPILDMSIQIIDSSSALSSSSSCQSPSSPQNVLTMLSMSSASSHASTPKSLSADNILSSSMMSEDPKSCNNSSSSTIVAGGGGAIASPEFEDAESVCSSPLRDVLRGFDNLFTSSPSATSEEEAPPSPLLVTTPCQVVDVSISAPDSGNLLQYSASSTACTMARGLHFDTNESSNIPMNPSRSSSSTSTCCGDTIPNLDWSYETGAENLSDEEDIGPAQSQMEDERATVEGSTQRHGSHLFNSPPVHVESILADFLIPPSNASMDTEPTLFNGKTLLHEQLKQRLILPWLKSSDLLVESVRSNAENLASAAIRLGMIIVEDNIFEPDVELLSPRSSLPVVAVATTTTTTTLDESMTTPSGPVGRKRAPYEMSTEEDDSSMVTTTDVSRMAQGCSFIPLQSSSSASFSSVDDPEGGGKDGNKRRRKPLESNDSGVNYDLINTFKSTSPRALITTSGLTNLGLTPIRIPQVTVNSMEDAEEELETTRGLNGLAITSSSESTPLSASVENHTRMDLVRSTTVGPSVRRVSSLSSVTSTRKKDRQQHSAPIGGIATSRSLPLNVRWSDEVNAKEVMRRRERLVSLEEDYDASLVAFGCRDASSPRLRIHIPSPLAERVATPSATVVSSSSSPTASQSGQRSLSRDFDRGQNPLIIPTASPLPQLLNNVDSRTASSWPVSLQGDLKFGVGPSMRCWPVQPPVHSPLSPAYAHHLFCHYHSLESASVATISGADTATDAGKYAAGEASEVKDLLRVALKRAFSAGQKELRLMLALKEKVTH